MSAFADSNFNAEGYFNARPHYPKELFDFLVDQADKTSLDVCVDIGCGPGEATFELAKHFKRVIGVDPSVPMINKAKEQAHKRGITNVEFIIGTAEDFDTKIPGQVDAITSAEAAHWIKNIDSFWQRVHSKLVNGGIAAIWGYVDPIFPNSAANQMYHDFFYNDECKTNLAKYWERPGRDKLKSLFKDMDPPKTLFAKTLRIEGPSDTAEGRVITMTQKMHIPAIINYLKSYSAYAKYLEDHKSRLAKTSLSSGYTEETTSTKDPIEDLVGHMMKASGWTDDTEVDLEWQSVLLLGVKE